jgi:RNA polymerase sigma-70 factor, ECF subfamily
VGSEQGGPSDAALVQAVGARSQGALKEIYRRHGGAVWSVAKRVCRRTELAEEACQQVFAELWSDPGRFDPARGRLRSSLVARAHARAVELARPPAAAGGVGAGGDDSARDDAPARSTSPPVDGEVARHLDALPAEVRRAVDKLDAAERDAILLSYFGGRAHDQTARLLGTLDGTIKSHMRSGLSSLRRTLDVEEVTG